MRWFRHLVFGLFVAVFLLVCPLLVLYALGYALRPGSEQGLVKTGLVSIATNPPGASVYLENRRYTRRTPTILRGLLPGQYTIKLLLKHHRPWVQVVPIEEEKATVLDTVLLLPTRWQPEVEWPHACERLLPIPGTSVFVVMTGAQLKDAMLYDAKEDAAHPLAGFDPALAEARVASILTEPGSAALLLHVEARDGAHWLWAQWRRGAVTLEEITNLMFGKPKRVAWDARHRQQLISLQDRTLSRIDVASKAVYPRILDQVRSVAVFGRSVYVVKDDGQLLRVGLEGRAEAPLVEDPQFAQRVAKLRGAVEVRVDAEDVVWLLDEAGSLLINQPPYELARDGVRGLAWDPIHRRAVIWQKSRLGIVEFSPASKEEDAEPLPRIQWVYQGGRDIEQAVWVYEGSHLLARDRDQLFLLELETYGKPHLEYLWDVKPNADVAYAEELGRVYYLDRLSHQLSTVQLIPLRDRLILLFPEGRDRRKKSELQPL